MPNPSTKKKEVNPMAPANEAPTKSAPVPTGSTAASLNGPGQPQPASATKQPPAPQPAVDQSTPPTDETDGKKNVQRDVDYTIEFLDDLPGESTGGQGRPSVFEDRIDELKSDPAKQRKWARLASYKNASAAAAAANVLRQRHGLPYVEGLHVETRKVDGRTLLFVKMDPSAAEEGGKERWNKAEAERKAKLAQKRAEREAEKAKTGTASVADPVAAGTAAADTASTSAAQPQPQAS
jgi:hypothetical protein